MQIFGVPIDNLSRQTILKQIHTWLLGGAFHRITTVNPEFLLLAQENPSFKQSLLAADLRVADGAGINFPFWLAGEELLDRFPGADMLQVILELAEREHYPIGLFLHDHGLSSPEKIRRTLRSMYPQLIIVPTEVILSGAKIIFCNYGAPLQEFHLESLREKSKAQLVMGVGGAFDFLTGERMRAPKVLRQLGLEWLWRLIQQPSRFKRIWNAVVVFPIKVLSQK